jgi:hypothetical protein
MSVDITLVRRQDLIMRAVDALAFPGHDRVTLQVCWNKFLVIDSLQIALTDEGPPLSLFAICRKGKQNLVRTERKEFKVSSTILIDRIMSAPLGVFNVSECRRITSA